jgi:hypothetical protein
MKGIAMSKGTPYKKVLASKVQRFTIWDNFERHCAELRAIGATDADFEPLRAAATAVSKEEAKDALASGRNPVLEDTSLQELLLPVRLPNGWEIAYPTKPAKRWASYAVLKVTGGSLPADSLSQALAIAAGLWTLWQWSAGEKDLVMRTLSTSGKLADLLPEIEEALVGVDPDAAAGAYLDLMGLKKNAMVESYDPALQALRTKFSQPSTAAASSSLSPGAGASESPGGST